MNADPYFSSLQGGDYHVYPDGRILMSGVHNLLDSIRGFEGLYCLVWFSNTGYLDTTKTHRTCAGSLDKFTELPNGQFIGSGSTGVWDGQQASNIIRFNTDGSLDPSFQANVNWGQAYGFLPLDDGRVYAAGLFRILGNPDTLRLARFTPDGSLDPSFNLLSFETVETNNGFGAIISKVYALDETRLIVVGGYERVNGETRKGICMIDTAGNLLDDHFVDAGCGYYDYQGFTHGSIDGFTQAPNGSYYIWGAYHGYDDGTTNDTTQRMVSRLYGLDVGISENANTQPKPELAIHPNPANGWVAFHYDLLVPPTDAYLIVQDLSGRELYRLQLLEEKHQIVWDTRSIGAGTYIVSLVNKERDLRSEKLVIQQ
ncbi:MAG: hypothetical protein IPI00_09310 [Flavobacteriales bacterium]|nr:hypothetical protein [Flavobacteriales bacterium]MBK6944162.1 hypothetical protein [Flavobacteriales bacterium]MBK7240363.1 hypothetical protein [Flavobacteriales bacterium]MBK7295343.1 hypothetical protein [Flavobacteriales bacterium]MBK9533829.1 hypothetical protein [Flavobacteriales bacterium]